MVRPREFLICFESLGNFFIVLYNQQVNPGTVFLKKLNVHAAPRRAVPRPYRPTPREHLIFSARLGKLFTLLYIQ